MANVELVIKIPKDEYEHLTDKEKFYSLSKSKQEWLINKILNYVIDSTPLPKGHGRLIDVNALIADSWYLETQEEVMDAPTIIEANKEKVREQMEIVINIPKTDKEIKQEMEKQTEKFRKMGLLPVEESKDKKI